MLYTASSEWTSLINGPENVYLDGTSTSWQSSLAYRETDSDGDFGEYFGDQYNDNWKQISYDESGVGYEGEWIQSNDYKDQAANYGVGTSTYIDDDTDFIGYTMEITTRGASKQPGNVVLLASNSGDFSLNTTDSILLYSVNDIGQLHRDYHSEVATVPIIHMIPMLDSNFDVTSYKYYRLVFRDITRTTGVATSGASRTRIETIKYTSFISASSNFPETNDPDVDYNVYNLVENSRYQASRWKAELNDAPNSFSGSNPYTGPWLQFNRYHLSQFPNGYEHIGKIMKIYCTWTAATPYNITLLGSNSDDFDVEGNTTVETIINQEITGSTNETDLTVDDTIYSRMIEVDMASSSKYEYYRIIFRGVWQVDDQGDNPVVQIAYIEFVEP